MIYLATPYNHTDPAIRVARFDAVNKVAAELMRDGLHVFSPISHSHPIALVGDLPKGWEYWAVYDRTMLGICDALVVLMLDGWMESIGVNAEIAIAKEMGLPITYMVPE